MSTTVLPLYSKRGRIDVDDDKYGFSRKPPRINFIRLLFIIVACYAVFFVFTHKIIGNGEIKDDKASDMRALDDGDLRSTLEPLMNEKAVDAKEMYPENYVPSKPNSKEKIENSEEKVGALKQPADTSEVNADDMIATTTKDEKHLLNNDHVITDVLVPSSTIKTFKKDAEKITSIINAFKHAWSSYEKYAFGKDYLKPLSKTPGEWFGVAASLIDALDTAFLMNLTSIVQKSENYIKYDLRFDHDGNFNLFELSIRILGSFLTMFGFTKEEVYLERAVELADYLILNFDTPSGIPKSSYQFDKKIAVQDHTNEAIVAEATSIQLEWKLLAYYTGNTTYWKVAEDVMKAVFKVEAVDGLVPVHLNTETGDTWSNYIRLGAFGDSYYEYLFKQYIQLGKEEVIFKEKFEEALNGIIRHMVGKSKPSNLTFVGIKQNGVNGSLLPTMEHLACYIPGTVLLYVSDGKFMTKEDIENLSSKKKEYFTFAKELLHTCVLMYKNMPSGLSPDQVYFSTNEDATDDMYVHTGDTNNRLRPETVESLFYFYRITGNETYRETAWEIFQSIEKHSKVEDGYCSLKDVTSPNPEKEDYMESFFMAETLKYFYLIFEDDSVLPLDKYLFNTEAHPFPIISLKDEFKAKLTKEKLGLFGK